MATASKLTSKYQATIPKPVRDALGLERGDAVLFEVRGSEVLLRRAKPIDLLYLRSVEQSLTEWSSEEDEAAYRDL